MPKPLTADDVGWVIEAVASNSTTFDELDLRWLGPPAIRDEATVPLSAMELPGVHAAPLGQRAVMYFLVMRSQALRNGIDGFVYNAYQYLPLILEVFEAVGAHGAASTVAELAAGLDHGEDLGGEPSGERPVFDFLAFRTRVGGPWPSADPREDVREAIFRLGREHPEAFADP